MAVRAPSTFEMLKMATILREKHGIPKVVLKPLECYGFIKEWETIDELEDDKFALELQCLLATERLSMEYKIDIRPHQVAEGIFFNYQHFILQSYNETVFSLSKIILQNFKASH